MKYYRTEKKSINGTVYQILEEARLNDQQQVVWVEVMRIPDTTSGGGGGSQPGPNTVGTDQIIDGAVMMEDLNQQVIDEMITKDDRVKQAELDNFDV